MPLVRSAVALVAAMASGASAGTTYTIEVSNHVDAVHPSCIVEVWASFDPGDFAFAGAEFDLIATADLGGFTTMERVLDGPGTSDGKTNPGQDRVNGILAGQIKQYPKDPHLVFDNPVLIWRGTWKTQSFATRTVELRTQTDHLEIYANDSFQAVSRMGMLTEGAGLIRVGGCYADCDEDGATDIFDYLCFMNGFNAMDPAADCDGNAAFDIFDFLCFVNVFNEGC